ncbi:MAG: ABC transporter ATP-binding protein [Candidatus Bathyarchaeota archaeon]|nr:ABC transporter ATP-binding protein [Candidatus Bathyarchaeum tardum]WGM88725.1 MAG: ABC transporter ATP-binding protein [Candidatus Bathyarchaeum tardum]WNZ29021.1 MAG: ABC transporter ATP-binding protein [Candidatus Bathyarchaeota archaeon]
MNGIEINAITKRFEDTLAVDNISLNVTKGELFGLLGPNGAGKSTLTKMISGMINPTSGTIKVGDYDIQKHPIKVKENLGVVPQEIVLYDYLNAKENLSFYGRLYGLSGTKLKTRIQELLKFTQLEEKAVKRHVSTYSGGMKRRVNIAAALLHEPEVILLDEPTAGLDPQNKLALWEIIESLKSQGKTIVLTTHMMEEAEELCTRVAIMDHGKIIALGSPNQLVKEIKMENTITIVPDKIESKLIEHVKLISGVQNAYNAYDETEKKETLKVITDCPDDILPEIVSTIVKDGAKVMSVQLSRVTLEDVFIALTGRTLRE